MKIASFLFLPACVAALQLAEGASTNGNGGRFNSVLTP